MSVTLPSDLVVDVMRNADPVRRKAAVARLDAAAQGQGFAQVIDGLHTAAVRDASGLSTSAVVPASASPDPHRKGQVEAYEGFERMVLRNLFEALLPSEESGTFGGGPSAGIWRSMAADQLAGVYAKDGGIGVARMMIGETFVPGPRHEAQWPYFRLDTIGAFKNSVAS